jgi:hypothetical protein
MGKGGKLAARSSRSIQWKDTLVGPDGVHLTHKLAGGPPTEENLKNCGYLLRCYVTVQKLKEVKEKVIDKARKQPSGNGAGGRGVAG